MGVDEGGSYVVPASAGVIPGRLRVTIEFNGCPRKRGGDPQS